MADSPLNVKLVSQSNRRNSDGYRTGHFKTSSRRVRTRKSATVRANDLCSDVIIPPTAVTDSVLNVTSPFQALLGDGGQLATYPQVMKPCMAGQTGVLDFVGRIRVIRVMCRFNTVGSQANAILPADLFNRIRIVLIRTRGSFRESINFNTFTIDSPLDVRDCEVMYDEVINLSSTAFDSASGYNVPATHTTNLNLFLNREYELFSTASGVQWDTKAGSIRLYCVSESSVAPHPILSGYMRLVYKIVD